VIPPGKKKMRIACACGAAVLEVLGGTWSDALLERAGVRRALDGVCGLCGHALTEPQVITLCGQPLCIEPATHTCHVIGGPTLYFCKADAEKMQAAAREAGVASKIVMRPAVAAPPAAS
jgi:hypothetical protein